ncbi:MAG: DUF4893 domain-containing protein [Paracoccus sp. (in: a-proteobacteria)]|uniref:DUF4893 domain-containing protein n=1 Tax=Paracoccus sp. TaxID=267 RepID=UPI0026E0223C|nr:DUF4893 domain-containing protein [Paracoccus sp. (in: a-proteobacteria)]MDO5632402.1 DUF4893 domain-containing protein [Paracoccus sp. (in: a-proteobacteria)]
MSFSRTLLLAVLLAAPAAAQDRTATLPDGTLLRADDAARLNDLDAATGQALRQALAEAAPADLATLTKAMQGQPLPPQEALTALQGEWTCQTIKVGGGLPLVVYPPFRCQAGPDGSFDKVTGSQRTTGQTTIFSGLPLYVGTAYVQGSTPLRYADFGEAPPPDPGVTAPDVGVIEMTGPDSGRILFPRPYVESVLNVLVLTR